MKSIGSNISSLRPTPVNPDVTRTPASGDGVANSVFRDQLSALQNVKPSTIAANATGTNAATAAGALKFSNHAIDRMRARGISFSPEQMMKIEGAVNKAAGKGAKDTLLLTDESALIVNVKDKTVVTVMDKANLKENVFTNIDSTVMI